MAVTGGGIMARENSAATGPDIHFGATEKMAAWSGGKMKGRNRYAYIYRKRGSRLMTPQCDRESI